jgi:hypothetical protein
MSVMVPYCIVYDTIPGSVASTSSWTLGGEGIGGGEIGGEGIGGKGRGEDVV